MIVMQNQNMVAKILKVYAIVNAVFGIFLGLYWMSEGTDFLETISIFFMAICLVVSFGIYAFGEVIQLLQDIKDGTQGTMNSISKNIDNNSSDDLPNI